MQSFSWVYEVTQYPHENNMGFCDNNWEKGEDFVNVCRVKKSCVGDMEESLSVRGWHDIHEKHALVFGLL